MSNWKAYQKEQLWPVLLHLPEETRENMESLLPNLKEC
jgi:hypothetical protein